MVYCHLQHLILKVIYKIRRLTFTQILMYGILVFQIFYLNIHFCITKARTSASVNDTNSHMIYLN